MIQTAQQHQQHTMQHMRHPQRTAVTDTMIEIYTTFPSEACHVGAGVDVAMGIMVSIATNAVGEMVVAARKETEQYG